MQCTCIEHPVLQHQRFFHFFLQVAKRAAI